MKRITLMLCASLLLTSCNQFRKEKAVGSELTTKVELSPERSAPSPAEHEPNLEFESKPNAASGGTYGFSAATSGTVATYTVGVADATINKKDEVTTAVSAPSTTPIPVSQNRMETKIPTKIIRNAHINFQVDSTDRTHGHIVQLLKLYQAYFGSDNRVQYGDQIQQNMTIRVPSEHFDELVDALMKESVYTNSKNITAEDVTSEFVDQEARLRSKKEVEKRYLELLARAQKVTDVIEVESNLRLIREEIESTEGRLKLLKDQVGYSTIDLSIYQKVNAEIQPETGMGHRIKEAVVSGWRGLEFFLLALINMWPLLIAGGIIAGWIAVRIRRNRA